MLQSFKIQFCSHTHTHTHKKTGKNLHVLKLTRTKLKGKQMKNIFMVCDKTVNNDLNI